MPSFCAILNCTGRYGISDNISFHRFPLKRSDLLGQWEAFVQQQRGPEWRASRWSSLCSLHFRETDFRSQNERRILKRSAVPTIMNLKEKIYAKNSSKNKTTNPNNNDMKTKEAIEIANIKESLEEMENLSKSICRLCGKNAISVSMISNNLEVLNTIQKCFPNINIEQNDALPKSLCASCLKSLHQFSVFVDLVWTTQTDLQNKYRLRFAEKSLKIKQEPVVRVKQEAAESVLSDTLSTAARVDNNNFENSYDAHLEDINKLSIIEQKYDFCDFPIINDCDIMEIINLDDPFINIPDDDNTTNSTNDAQQQQQMRTVFQKDAQNLLQVHSLLEEHNYAYTRAHHFKEERICYKTEQSDGYDYEIAPTTNNSPNANDIPLIQTDHINEQQPDNDADKWQPTSEDSSAFNNRAVKPIVTSVSAIQVPSKSSNGIIVLNESIVKSGSGSQLHDCMVCQLKFLTIAKLKQHYTQTHGTPMVSLPAVNTEKIIETNNNVKNEEQTLDNPNEEDNSKSSDLAYDSNIPTPASKSSTSSSQFVYSKTKLQKSIKKSKIIKSRKRFHCYHNYELNAMAVHCKQLRKLYQKLQKKCVNLEQNVEQLQLQPALNKSNRIRPSSPLTKRRNYLRNITSKSKKFTCSTCSKNFTTSYSLKQHTITHTEERNHFCHLCSRAFKRRNGLLQHLKGFHMQVKPFACPVCKHSYALKCDMQRCKHSAMKTARTQ